MSVPDQYGLWAGLTYATPFIGLAASLGGRVEGVPVALIRNRQQSLTDKEIEHQTKQPRHGDAAFADYVISAGLAIRFGAAPKAALPVPVWPPAN